MVTSRPRDYRAGVRMPTLALDTTFTPRPRVRRKIGLLAGWGRFPLLVAEDLARQGCDTFCLGVKDHADPQLQRLCAHFEWVGLGKLGAAIRYFRRHQVHDLTMAGKIHKHRLLERWGFLRHFPDWRTLRRFFSHLALAKKERNDDSLLLAVVDEFATAGLTFHPATDFVPELLVKLGKLTARGPTAGERGDIEYGWRLAKEMGRLDIGQSVVIKGKATIAVEAIEGTDACIERAGRLCRSGGFTVVKVAKPRQDMRFDVPTVGLGTIETIVAAGATCLAVEAGRTILLDQAEVLKFADRHRVAIVALDADGLITHTSANLADNQTSPETP